jgi:hypothetical protein
MLGAVRAHFAQSLQKQWFPTTHSHCTKLMAKKNQSLQGPLRNHSLMEREAATRSVQHSHKLWHDPSFVNVDEADLAFSFLALLFLGALKYQKRASTFLWHV